MTGHSGKTGTIAGVDGCRAGWIALVQTDGSDPRVEIRQSFADLVSCLGAGAVIAVDMPIGLPDKISGAGRGPEQLVRPFLGARQSSVFSIPARGAVEAQSYAEACAKALETSDPPRKVSKQAFFLFAKILEIDALLRADTGLCARVIECHPEFSFCRLNGGVPMQAPKKIKGAVNPAGIAERVGLLERYGLDGDLFAKAPPRGAAMDDLVDAAVNLVMARRHTEGRTRPFPDPPLQDRHGLRVAIYG